jgi:hypothetical protein
MGSCGGGGEIFARNTPHKMKTTSDSPKAIIALFSNVQSPVFI